MAKVEPNTVNSSQFDKKIVIATQGSEFKNQVTGGLIDHIKKDSIFIQVVDVSSLDTLSLDNYIAMLLIHTWENWKPPTAVKDFIEKSTEERDRIIVLTTSGEGTYKMEGIDAITGESNPKNVKPFTDEIIRRLDKLINPNK